MQILDLRFGRSDTLWGGALITAIFTSMCRLIKQLGGNNCYFEQNNENP